MRVLVNGAAREVPDGITVAGLVRDVRGDAGDARGVAVAVDAEVVPRGEWDSVELADGQRVEVVGAIQGG
jgi:sulfur carrier protein